MHASFLIPLNSIDPVGEISDVLHCNFNFKNKAAKLLFLVTFDEKNKLCRYLIGGIIPSYRFFLKKSFINSPHSSARTPLVTFVRGCSTDELSNEYPRLISSAP